MEENEYINCQNFKKFKKALFTLYRDFECVLISANVNIDVCLNTKKYNIILFPVLATKCFVTTCIDEQHSKLYHNILVKMLCKNL